MPSMASDDPKPDVLSSLPRTRPQRRSARRPAAASTPPAKAGPRATATATRRIPPAGFAPPRADEGRTPSGTEIVGTAIQAAGELAQMGLAIGGHALKGALGRIGRS